jgi:hypothetical protein
MKEALSMRCAIILGCLLLCAASAAADEVDDLSAALTSGSWSKAIGGPKMRDRYVYTFAKDGTYKSVLVTDFAPFPTTTGRWQLVKGKDRKIHLRLKNEGGKYPWLREDSIIRYDRRKDALLVSGARYAGEVPLRHQKGK